MQNIVQSRILINFNPRGYISGLVCIKITKQNKLNLAKLKK